MAELSLKIVTDEGAVTRMMKFNADMKVAHAYPIIKEKMHHMGNENDYGLFLPSVNDSRSGTWLAPQHTLQHYMLRDGDSLLLLNKSRNLRVKMLDGVVKTLQVDESKNVNDLIHIICGKIGITNHDEYGLCHEEMEQEEVKERPATGTLTLKRKPQRERDAKMEQLSKKLKTDDNVEWLDQHKTLREIGVDNAETLILKRRLFYTDRNVDSRDPKQLNMLYNENKAAILDGKHPVTEEQAINFAAIQCQVNFGDYNEEKHKPGFIEDLREYLPEQFIGVWGAEKGIVKLYRKYQGVSQLEAMHLYNKTARELPTYGVTFFLVKEKHSKGKNKLISCLLGINAEAILRLDVDTKEILQQWPITHVKTYHASKNETFMLDFGDYSDKPYSVKTTDAYRIRDILEGYIDMIRKKMMGNHNVHCADSGAVVQDEVHPSRGNTMTLVSGGPNKIVEHSFVGPSKIIPFEQGSECQQGTQMMTVQQVIITNKGSQQQQVISGGVPMRSDISRELMMKLNRLNSNAVKIVTFLSDPTDDNIKQVRASLETIEEELPVIESGVKDAAEKQRSEEAKRKLLKELEELLNLCATMSRDSKTGQMDVPKMDENAKRLADLTTQIVFAVDPKAQGRIRSLRNSRKSFIQDEKIEATLRRASFLTAADGATSAVQTALETLDQEYTGPALTDQELDRLEASAVDKLGKLNAAVALFLNAHADPANIDYATAVNSMNTIKELLPKLARDVKALSEASDADGREALLDEIRSYCEAARTVCALTGCDDHEKLQNAANQYADISGRLLYTFGGRNPRVNADKENEIVELAREVGVCTGALLVVANGVVEAAGNDPAAAALDAAGVHAALAARDLLTTAQVSAPTIHEPHCRSALSASAEHVATRAQLLALAWRPLVQGDDKRQVADDLTNRSLLLAEALDRLKRAYANIEERELQCEEPSPAEAARLRFISSISSIKDKISDAQNLLDEPVKPAKLSESEINGLQDNISQKLGHINAAVTALLEAKSDPQNPDYNSAELAMKTISELMPDVIKDAKSLVSVCPDERARRAMLNDVRAWCDGIAGVCDNFTADDKKCLDEAAKDYARASKKLSFAFSPRARKAREQLMMELFDSAHRKAMDLVDDTNKMADTIGGANGVRLRDLGNAVEDSANSLRTTLLVSAPSLSDSQCRSALANRSGQLCTASSLLADAANSLQDDETGCRILAAKLQEQRAHITSHADELSRALQSIRATLDDATPVVEEAESPSRAVQRLKFVSSASAAKRKAEEAADILNQPDSATKLSDQEAKLLEDKLAKELAATNSAVATLIRAKADRQHPDYEAAELALKMVSDLLPSIIKDSKAYSTTCADEASRAAMLHDIRAWCDAVQAVCASAQDDDIKGLNDSALKLSDSTQKLRFIFSASKNPVKEQQILQLSSSACDKARQMAKETQRVVAAISSPEASMLQQRALVLDDAATALHTTTQLTLPSINEPQCRAALVTAADAVSESASALVRHTASAAHPAARRISEECDRYRIVMEKALDSLRTVVLADDTRGKSRPPPVPVKKSSLSKESGGQAARRVRVVSHSDGRRASQDWLDHMRQDASLDIEASNQAPPGLSAKDIQALTKRAEEERIKKDNLAKALDKVERNMVKVEQGVDEIGSKKFTGTELDEDRKKGLQKQVEQKLALAGIAASKFITSNHPDEVDYAAGAQHADDISELVADIVKDATQLSNTRDQKYRSALLDQIKALCEATRRLARTANADNEKLSEAAVEFGEKSAKLVYLVSEEADPEQEKGVICEAKAIGESAIRLAERGAALAGRAAPPRAAAATAAAAAHLVYTVKLIAPFVHHQQCQNTLISSSHELSSSLKKFSTEFKTFSTDPKLSTCVTEMNTEAVNLEKLLETFRHDLAAGKLVKRREVEEIQVESTALRWLASQIMDVAQQRAESSNVADDKKDALSQYAGQLRAAIRALDLAHTRTKRAPLDLKRRRDLEDAVQNLQITLLQSRPSLEDKPTNNIVDLTDFVRETNAEAEKLLSAASKIDSTEDKIELDVIKDECHKINLEAFKILNPSERGGDDDNSVDDIAEVDQFGEDCETRIKKMSSAIARMKEDTNKTKLAENMLALTESCSMLRFAAKSALSTAQSAALDETLEDLIDLEKRIDQIITPVEGDLDQKDHSVSCEEQQRCVWRVVEAVGALGRAVSAALPAALLAHYHCALRAHTHPHKLKAHALKLIELSKLLTAAVGNRVAMWQKLACPEVADITLQILKELENPEISTELTADKDYIPILTPEDIQKALTPSKHELLTEDPNSSMSSVQQCALRLVSMAACLARGAHSAAALRRAAPAVLSAAHQLQWHIQGHPAKTLAQKKRIIESCQEMQWSTFGLLRAAETVSRQSSSAPAKQRLQAAQRSLVDIVNKVIREVSSNTSSSEVQLSCNEAARTLQARCNPQPAALSALPYSDCLHTLVEQRDVLEKLESDEPMSRAEFSKCLTFATAAVSNSAECAAHCAYLLSISENNKVAAKEGLVDVGRLHKLLTATNDVCMRIMRTTDVEMAKEEESKLRSLSQELTSAVKTAGGMCTEPTMKRELTELGFKIELAATELSAALTQDQHSVDKNMKCASTLVSRLSALNDVVERPGLVPLPGELADDTRMLVDDVMNHSQKLVSKTQALHKDVKNSPDDEPMTWVTFNTSRKSLLEAFDELLKTLRHNGEQAGLVEAAETEEAEEDTGVAKGYLELQEQRARVWLVDGRLPRAGQDACTAIIKLVKLLAEDVTGTEKEELDNMISEAEKLLEQCTKKYDKKTASGLMSVIRSLRRCGARGVAARVVDDFLSSEAPLQDLETFLDAEKDDARRKYLLEQKIAELMAQLGRSSRTARLAARATPRPQQLDQCREKTELLAPALVKAAEERMARPNDQAVVDNYRRLLAQYAESLSQVQEMCDRSVDPMDFVQAAGETMARMREESSRDNNPQMCAYTSSAITRLARRVISVSMSSCAARGDSALAAALAEARGKLDAAVPPPGARASTLPDWKDTTEQILRTTGEVESTLRGENIFKKQREPDQPIYNAALNLHEAVRGWSARDNEIVAVAKRMAVLMARLSEQMYTDRKRELIATSKSIVTESCEVAALAKKLALECTDIRIRTNLLNVCERIPTISAQLKMLTSVKATSLANHGGEDDREGMNMIVGNAQNLMSSVQEVVKVAASASVKIASQRGLKWVRRNY